MDDDDDMTINGDSSLYRRHHYGSEEEDPSQFQCLVDVLGKGSVANVSLVVDSQTKVVGAMKTYKQSKTKFAIQELFVFRRVNLSTTGHLIRYLDAFLYEGIPMFLTEYAPFGTLDRLISRKQGLGSEASRMFALEISQAVLFLHEHMILHRDVKPDNVFIMVSGHVALGDFSLAYEMDANSPLPYQVCGTHVTRPPEVWLCKGYSFPSDIWQLGITLYNMASNQWPFFHADVKKQSAAVRSGDKISFPEDRISHQMTHLINQMLQVDPNQRIQAHQVIGHRYFTKSQETLQQLQPPFSTKELMEMMTYTEMESQVVRQLIDQQATKVSS